MPNEEFQLRLTSKRLNPALHARVGRLYREGFYEEAVNNAFKVLEERMREVSGTQENGIDLVKTVWNQTTGMLSDPNAWVSEREGTYLLFRSVFLAFRNSPAHRFMNTNQEEAFDLIVLVNRLLLLVEEADRRRIQTNTSIPVTPQMGIRDSFDPVTLDVDGDGRHDLLIQRTVHPAHSEEPFQLFELTEAGLVPMPVHHADTQPWGMFEDAYLADIDGDGFSELVIFFVGATTGSSVSFYRLRHGYYEIMDVEAPGNQSEYRFLPHFLDAHLEDFDKDGILEVVSAPWGTVPHDLMPENSSEEVREMATGRTRYVFKWNRTKDKFELITRELGYLGGR